MADGHRDDGLGRVELAVFPAPPLRSVSVRVGTVFAGPLWQPRASNVRVVVQLGQQSRSTPSHAVGKLVAFHRELELDLSKATAGDRLVVVLLDADRELPLAHLAFQIESVLPPNKLAGTFSWEPPPRQAGDYPATLLVSGRTGTNNVINGTYDLLPGQTHGSRPCYQNADSELFLYFHPHNTAWLIGTRLGHEAAPAYVNCDVDNPADIDRVWNVAAFGRFEPDPKLKVSLIGHTRTRSQGGALHQRDTSTGDMDWARGGGGGGGGVGVGAGIAAVSAGAKQYGNTHTGAPAAATGAQMSLSSHRRRLALDALVDSEREYTLVLKSLVEGFVLDTKLDYFWSNTDKSHIFRNITQLLDISQALVDVLSARLRDAGARESCLCGALLLKTAKNLHSALAEYAAGRAMCERTLSKVVDSNHELRTVLEDKSHKAGNKDLRELLAEPLARVREYVALFQQMQDATVETDPDYVDCESAADTMRWLPRRLVELEHVAQHSLTVLDELDVPEGKMYDSLKLTPYGRLVVYEALAQRTYVSLSGLKTVFSRGSISRKKKPETVETVHVIVCTDVLILASASNHKLLMPPAPLADVLLNEGKDPKQVAVNAGSKLFNLTFELPQDALEFRQQLERSKEAAAQADPTPPFLRHVSRTWTANGTSSDRLKSPRTSTFENLPRAPRSSLFRKAMATFKTDAGGTQQPASPASTRSHPSSDEGGGGGLGVGGGGGAAAAAAIAAARMRSASGASVASAPPLHGLPHVCDVIDRMLVHALATGGAVEGYSADQLRELHHRVSASRPDAVDADLRETVGDLLQKARHLSGSGNTRIEGQRVHFVEKLATRRAALLRELEEIERHTTLCQNAPPRLAVAPAEVDGAQKEWSSALRMSSGGGPGPGAMPVSPGGSSLKSGTSSGHPIQRGSSAFFASLPPPSDQLLRDASAPQFDLPPPPDDDDEQFVRPSGGRSAAYDQHQREAELAAIRQQREQEERERTEREQRAAQEAEAEAAAVASELARAHEEAAQRREQERVQAQEQERREREQKLAQVQEAKRLETAAAAAAAKASKEQREAQEHDRDMERARQQEEQRQRREREEQAVAAAAAAARAQVAQAQRHQEEEAQKSTPTLARRPLVFKPSDKQASLDEDDAGDNEDGDEEYDDFNGSAAGFPPPPPDPNQTTQSGMGRSVSVLAGALKAALRAEEQRKIEDDMERASQLALTQSRMQQAAAQAQRLASNQATPRRQSQPQQQQQQQQTNGREETGLQRGLRRTTSKRFQSVDAGNRRSIVAPTLADVGASKTVVAKYKYAAEDGNFSFAKGDTMTLIDKLDANWWRVKGKDGKEGLAPVNYIEVAGATPTENGGADASHAAPAARASAAAINGSAGGHAASSSADADADDPFAAGSTAVLQFKYDRDGVTVAAGDAVDIVAKVDANWVRARIPSGQVGLLPINYLKPGSKPKSATNVGNAQPPLERVTAQFAYEQPDGDLVFSPGDELELLEQIDDAWCRVQHEQNGEVVEGTAPLSYVLREGGTPSAGSRLDSFGSTGSAARGHTRQQSAISGVIIHELNIGDAVRGKYDYVSDFDDLQYQEGDPLQVVDKVDNNWLMVKHLHTGIIGLAPRTYLFVPTESDT